MSSTMEDLHGVRGRSSPAKLLYSGLTSGNQFISELIVIDYLQHGRANARWIAGIAIERGVSTNLRQRRGIRYDGWAIHSHRFERREAKALIERREHQRSRVAIPAAQLFQFNKS